jgi:hypothetical protein
VKKQLMVSLDEDTIEALRRIAVRKGLLCRRGPGAPVKRGNISMLLVQLAREATE